MSLKRTFSEFWNRELTIYVPLTNSAHLFTPDRSTDRMLQTGGVDTGSRATARTKRAAARIEPVYIRLGRRIRILRKNAGMSQKALAKFLDLARANIANIEGGRQRISLHQIGLLAAALNKRPDELLHGIW
jgi:DNA-binding XRE family transcriptional regulator